MTFDHRVAGTPAAAWDQTLSSTVELAAPGPGDHIVVLAAHPDDETLGAAGLMALAARAGAQVTVIVASDGEASHPSSPTQRPAQLAHRRRIEVRDGVAAVAPAAQVRLLGLPDGQLSDHLAEITDAVDQAAAGCTHLVTPWAGDRHPDHAACAQAAAESVAALHALHWQFPIWAWHWADPEEADLPTAALRLLHLDADARQAKHRALDCHVSQHSSLSDQPGDEPVLATAMLDHFRRDAEVFVAGAAPGRTPDGYFDGLYRRAGDPWGLASRFYEQRKRAVLLAALTRPRFRRAFEPGCATGLLTAQLARRCDEVIAWDVAEQAIDLAATHLGDCRGVTLERRAVPDDWPTGRFDLIVLSEVGYYCADPSEVARQVHASLTDDGVVAACHWRRDAAMHPQTAADVHDALGAGLQPVVTHVEEDFLLHVWSRDGRSVAALDGILG